MKCYTCDQGELTKKKVDYIQLGINLGKFNALVCNTCKETFFEAEASEEIEKAAKAKGIWGIAARTRIGTSGNALDVKLPKVITEFLELKKGQDIIIEALDKKRFQVTIE